MPPSIGQAKKECDKDADQDYIDMLAQFSVSLLGENSQNHILGRYASPATPGERP